MTVCSRWAIQKIFDPLQARVEGGREGEREEGREGLFTRTRS